MPNIEPEWEDPIPPDQGDPWPDTDDSNYTYMDWKPTHFVSGCCEGVKCRICEMPATHKVSEVIFADEPMPIFNINGKEIPGSRHEYTAYVCCDCFKMIFGEWTCSE